MNEGNKKAHRTNDFADDAQNCHLMESIAQRYQHAFVPRERQDQHGRDQPSHEHDLSHVHVLGDILHRSVIEGEAGHSDSHEQAATQIGG